MCLKATRVPSWVLRAQCGPRQTAQAGGVCAGGGLLFICTLTPRQGPGAVCSPSKNQTPLGHTEHLTLCSTVPLAHRFFVRMISKGSFALPTADLGSEAREQPKGARVHRSSLTRDSEACPTQGSASRRGAQRPDWVRLRVPGTGRQIPGDFRPKLHTSKGEPGPCPSWPQGPTDSTTAPTGAGEAEPSPATVSATGLHCQTVPGRMRPSDCKELLG